MNPTLFKAAEQVAAWIEGQTMSAREHELLNLRINRLARRHRCTRNEAWHLIAEHARGLLEA